MQASLAGAQGLEGDACRTKFYATVVTQGESNIDVLTTRIEKISTVSGADIRAVLYALVDVISVEMSEGRIVRLGDLGYMRVSVASKGETTADDVSSNSVQGAKNPVHTRGGAQKNAANAEVCKNVKQGLKHSRSAMKKKLSIFPQKGAQLFSKRCSGFP